MARNVWLFVPNLIGYARFLFLLISLFYVVRADGTNMFLALYAASYLLDAADGPAARSLQQTSRFGAVLDMVTDRVSTAVLLAALTHESMVKQWALAPAWLALLVLDIAAHWVQMYAALALGAASHKALPDEPALLTWYYKRVNLFVVCLLSESYLVASFSLSRGVANTPLCVGGGRRTLVAAPRSRICTHTNAVLAPSCPPCPSRRRCTARSPSPPAPPL